MGTSEVFSLCHKLYTALKDYNMMHSRIFTGFGLWIVAFIAAVQGKDITVTYTVKNNVDNESLIFEDTNDFTVAPMSFFDLMKKTQENNADFKFEYLVQKLGIYITTVNGVKEDHNRTLFWFLIKNPASGKCVMSSGIGQYFPQDKEHMILSFEHYSIFDKLPSCANDNKERNVVHLTYSAQSMIKGTAQFKISQNVEIKASAFFDIMSAVATSYPKFKFEYKMYDKFGPHITEINGVSEDPAKKLGWMYFKVDRTGKRCLISRGVSKFVPNSDDHILFSLEKYSVRDNVPDCENQGQHQEL